MTGGERTQAPLHRSNIHCDVTAPTPGQGSRCPLPGLPAGMQGEVCHQKSWCQSSVKHSSCSSECSFLMKSPLRLFSHGFLIFFFFIAKCCLLLLLVRGQTRTLSLSVRVHVNFSCLQRKREGEAGMRNYNHQLNTMCAPEIPEKSICASCSFSCLQLPSVKY